MTEHVRVLAWLHIALAAFNLLLGLTLLGVLSWSLAAVGAADAPESSKTWAAQWSPLLGGLGLLVVATSLPGIIAGIGLLRWRPWARILAIVVSALLLPQFPAGTALAVFSFWVLFNSAVAARFARRGPGGEPRMGMIDGGGGA